MRPRHLALSSLVLASGVLAGAAPDTPAVDSKDESKVSTKLDSGPSLPDVSKYTKFSEVAGTVIKVGKDNFTLRITWYTQSGGTRPNLYHGNHSHHQYYHPSRPRPAKVTEHHADHVLTFLPDGLVRWHLLSQEPGVKGVELKPADREKLKAPLGAPGWAADRSDLKPGDVVDLFLVRPNGVALGKITESDLRVKYAVIWRENGVVPKQANAGNKK